MSKTQKPIERRDATGHLNPQYARELLEGSGNSNEGSDAFIRRARTGDALSEELGEAFVESATSGEGAEPERKDRVLLDEQGGPFVPTPAAKEFATGTDASNIKVASREPLPKTSKADP
jgi:hypothetical protein